MCFGYQCHIYADLLCFVFFVTSRDIRVFVADTLVLIDVNSACRSLC